MISNFDPCFNEHFLQFSEAPVSENEITDEKVEKAEISPKSSASILEKEELDIIINVNDNDYTYDTGMKKSHEESRDQSSKHRVFLLQPP